MAWTTRRQEISLLGSTHSSVIQANNQAVSSGEVVTGILYQIAGLAELGGALETLVEGMDPEQGNIKSEMDALKEELRRQNNLIRDLFTTFTKRPDMAPAPHKS